MENIRMNAAQENRVRLQGNICAADIALLRPETGYLPDRNAP
jgi:hypothetical protein